MSAFSKTIFLSTVVTLWILFCSTIKAQGLQVGNQCPNFEIKQVVNHSSESIRLSDLIGRKSLLIDFWFSSCAACIESFPRLDSLQKEFREDLTILLVTFESEDKYKATFNRINRITNIKLPCAVSDTLLSLIFPHRSSPHEVWIDKNGIIKAITDHTQINRGNILRLIKGEALNLPIKKDNMDYSSSLPLISTLDKERTIKYSYISSYQPGVSGSIGIYINPETGFLQATAKNVSIQELYSLAYGKWGKDFNLSRIVNEGKNATQFKKPIDSIPLFCYDSWWRDTIQTKAFLSVQKELDRIFGINSKIEKRKIPCIILKETGTRKRFQSFNARARAEVYTGNDTLHLTNVYLRNPIQNILNYGMYAWSPFQFIDETGYRGKMSIKLPAKFSTIDKLNAYLKEFDLVALKEEKWDDVIVLE